MRRKNLTSHLIHYESFRDVANPDQLGDLYPIILQLVNKAFGKDTPEDETRDALVSSLLVLALNQEGEAIGMSTINRVTAGELDVEELKAFSPETVGYYLNAATIAEEYQGGPVFRGLAMRSFEPIIQDQAQFLITHTQNPKVEKGIHSMLSMAVKGGIIASYTLTRRKLAGFYGRQLTREKLDTKINSAFDELDMEKGDAFCIVVLVKYPE